MSTTDNHLIAGDWLRAISNIRESVPEDKLDNYDAVTRRYLKGLIQQGYSLKHINATFPCPGCSSKSWSAEVHEEDCVYDLKCSRCQEVYSDLINREDGVICNGCQLEEQIWEAQMMADTTCAGVMVVVAIVVAICFGICAVL